mgnify:CR=1 FL=1
MPASEIQLPELFLFLEDGQRKKNGYKYFTCSTSSLERVFMEIVRILEQEEQQNSNDDQQQRQIIYDAYSEKKEKSDDIHLDIKPRENDSDDILESIY